MIKLFNITPYYRNLIFYYQERLLFISKNMIVNHRLKVTHKNYNISESNDLR